MTKGFLQTRARAVRPPLNIRGQRVADGIVEVATTLPARVEPAPSCRLSQLAGCRDDHGDGVPAVELAKPQLSRHLQVAQAAPVPGVDSSLVAAAFMAQQGLHQATAFPTVDELLEVAVTKERLQWFAREPLWQPPVPKPHRLFVPDYSRVPVGSVLDLAFNIYVEHTGLNKWVEIPSAGKDQLDIFNAFIMLEPTAPHVQSAFDEAERIHSSAAIKNEKQEEEERKARQRMLRKGMFAEPMPAGLDVLDEEAGQADSQADSPLQHFHAPPVRSGLPLASSVAHDLPADDGLTGSGQSPERKKVRISTVRKGSIDCEEPLRPLIPPKLEEQARRMAELNTLEVEEYAQQLQEWEEEHAKEYARQLQEEEEMVSEMDVAAATDSAAQAYEEYEELSEKYSPEKRDFACDVCSNRASEVELGVVDIYGPLHFCTKCDDEVTSEQMLNIAKTKYPHKAPIVNVGIIVNVGPN